MRRAAAVFAAGALAAVPARARAEPPASPTPVHTPAGAINFRDAIARALARNPDRLVALAEIERVDGLLAQATSALLPQVAGNLTYTRLEGNRYVANKLEAAANSVLAALDVSSPLVDLHAYAERRRARDQVDVTAAQADAVKRSVAIATARAYFAALSAARFLAIAQHARDNASSHVAFATERHTAGVGNELDVARAETEVASDETQVASARTAKLRAEEALGVITGTDGALAAAGEPDLDAAHAGPGIAARADVIADVRARDAADWSRAHDWLDWVPTLHVSGDAFYTAPQIDPIPRLGYNVLVTLTAPIYDGGYRHGEHEQHEAADVETHEQEVGLDRQASSEVRVARGALDDSRAARDAAHRAADAATRTLALANTGYHAGTATGLEVVDAQRAALDAETQATIADDDYRQAQLDLLAATGAFPP
jgi:multidrug efflux system outer membrane protein